MATVARAKSHLLRLGARCPEGTGRCLQLVAAFGAVYLIWGSTYLGIRLAIDTLPPLTMAGVRFVIAGTLMYGWMRWRGARQGLPRPSVVHWRSALILGGLMLLGGNGGVTWSEQRVPTGLVALLIGTVPLWMALLEALRRGGTRPAGRTVVGLVLGFGGVAWLVGPGTRLAGPGIDLVGAGVVLAGALAWAAGSLYSRRAPLPAGGLTGTAMEMLAGGALLLLAGGLSGEWQRLDLAAVSARSLLAMGYLIVFGSIVAFTAYLWLLRNTTPARASTYAYVNPLVAVFLGWAVLGEALTPQIGLAMAVILAGVVLITR